MTQNQAMEATAALRNNYSLFSAGCAQVRKKQEDEQCVITWYSFHLVSVWAAVRVKTVDLGQSFASTFQSNEKLLVHHG
jgi:hypothetical protein